MSAHQKPRVFIGSSTEQLSVARAVNSALDHDAHCSVWTYGFDPGKFTLESLEDAFRKSDFAVFVLTPDDIAISRKKRTACPRDNVILELGISIGVLSRRRTFILIERSVQTKIPTDLLGVTPVTFERRQPLSAAVEAACNAIREQIIEQGSLPFVWSVGNIIAYSERSLLSTGFAASTLRTISVFAGDLSWLEEDLSTYQTLIAPGRNVVIRFLTDSPCVPVIKKAKRLGIEFRQYAGHSQAPLKASISDTDSEADARALIVRRHVPFHTVRDGTPYQYWMRVYRGVDEFPVIHAMGLLFESMWAKGKRL